MASAPPDACQPGPDLTTTENDLFDAADKEILHALTDRSQNVSPQVQNTIGRLNLQSAQINRTWPPENRFHASFLDVAPLAVVKMSYRNRATFSAFAPRQNHSWQKVDALDDGSDKPVGGYNWLDLYSLVRGPSKRARFLAKFGDSG